MYENKMVLCDDALLYDATRTDEGRRDVEAIWGREGVGHGGRQNAG